MIEIIDFLLRTTCIVIAKKKPSLIKLIFDNKRTGTVRKKITINIKYKFDEFKKTAFRNLQKIFFSLIFLTYYNQLRQFYVNLNAFKQRGFAVMIYHVLNDFSNDISFSRIAMQFIMFLNKCFNSVEKNY